MRLSAQQKTAGLLAALVAVMGAASFAAVPFYDWFCRVTGFGGATTVATQAPAEPLERTIRIRFDASRAAGMPWEFRPLQREMEVKIGATGLAFYEAVNPTSRTIAGTASYNVTPDAAGGHFAKIECFCFTEQVLGPGERVEMPVSFYVDPAIVDDPDGSGIRRITLSYTFHETALTEEQAALARRSDTDLN
ncbi:cytochrome c oxidase assembly protein [Rhodobacter sp. CZR27]|uniref:cytochrome c oxidase assembly protein n=1 Tax=Rhodobacter sp. CZR27 TaxID=2033869 RepID=UPI000BBEDD43|nr:cytochrome c oxidase assembly protein [Rhodobacter sp. CZR27]